MLGAIPGWSSNPTIFNFCLTNSSRASRSAWSLSSSPAWHVDANDIVFCHCSNAPTRPKHLRMRRLSNYCEHKANPYAPTALHRTRFLRFGMSPSLVHSRSHSLIVDFDRPNRSASSSCDANVRPKARSVSREARASCFVTGFDRTFDSIFAELFGDLLSELSRCVALFFGLSRG